MDFRSGYIESARPGEVEVAVGESTYGIVYVVRYHGYDYSEYSDLPTMKSDSTTTSLTMDGLSVLTKLALYGTTIAT